VKRVGGQREDPILGWRGPGNSPQRGGGGGKLSDGGGGGVAALRWVVVAGSYRGSKEMR
jgi:hypothetical protein